MNRTTTTDKITTTNKPTTMNMNNEMPTPTTSVRPGTLDMKMNHGAK